MVYLDRNVAVFARAVLLLDDSQNQACTDAHHDDFDFDDDDDDFSGFSVDLDEITSDSDDSDEDITSLFDSFFGE